MDNKTVIGLFIGVLIGSLVTNAFNTYRHSVQLIEKQQQEMQQEEEEFLNTLPKMGQ